MHTVHQLLPALDNARILLVDDEPGAIQWMGRVLAGYRDLRFATSGAEALAIASAWLPELVLLDIEMPGMDGYAVHQALRTDPLLADVPVVFITQHGEPQVVATAFERGAADFITKPVTGPVLLARVAMQLRLVRMKQRLAQLTARDSLTGLAERGYLDDQLRLACNRSLRAGRPLTLLLADIDGFSAFNQRQGRAAGDSCLRTLAHVMTAQCQRPNELAARHGADAFALLLPDTAAADALALTARLSRALRSGGDAPVTLSLGLAVHEAPAGTGTGTGGDLAVELHHQAQAALGRARQRGPGSACVQTLGRESGVPTGLPADMPTAVSARP